jgi:hypothetical protein
MVTWHPPSWVCPLVTHLLSFRFNPDLIWVKWGILVAKPPKWTMIVPKVVLIILSKRECLNTWFAYYPWEATQHSVGNDTHLDGPLRVEAEPDSVRLFDKSIEPLFQQVKVIRFVIVIVDPIVL